MPYKPLFIDDGKYINASHHEQEMKTCIQASDERAVLRMMDQGFDMSLNCNVRTVDETWTAMVARHDLPEVMTRLIKELAAEHFHTRTKYSLFVNAHRVHHKALVATGVDINGPAQYGHTPLSYYCAWYSSYPRESRLDTLKSFLAMGANPNKLDEKRNNCLKHLASTINCVDLVDGHRHHLDYEEAFKSLIQAGCDIHHKNMSGATALDVATRSNPSAVKILLDHGAQFGPLPEQFEQAIEKAIQFNETRTLDALLAHGFRPDSVGPAMIKSAFRHESPHALIWLMERGCELTSLDDGAGSTVEASARCLQIYRSFMARKEAQKALSQIAGLSGMPPGTRQAIATLHLPSSAPAAL